MHTVLTTMDLPTADSGQYLQGDTLELADGSRFAFHPESGWYPTPIWPEENAITGVAVEKIWNGTRAEYDAIVTKDPSTLYVIVA